MRYTQQNMSLHRNKKLRRKTSRASQRCIGDIRQRVERTVPALGRTSIGMERSAPMVSHSSKIISEMLYVVVIGILI
jgi:hypothetical protein